MPPPYIYLYKPSLRSHISFPQLKTFISFKPVMSVNSDTKMQDASTQTDEEDMELAMVILPTPSPTASYSSHEEDEAWDVEGLTISRPCSCRDYEVSGECWCPDWTSWIEDGEDGNAQIGLQEATYFCCTVLIYLSENMFMLQLGFLQHFTVRVSQQVTLRVRVSQHVTPRVTLTCYSTCRGHLDLESPPSTLL